MRPVSLTLDGFRSYAEAATFTWEGRRLVGIVGPIGSGKSTILDGIAFALYGKTPRVERDVRSLINQRRDEGKAALTFDVDGQRWLAVRALRRRGASAHTLYRIVDGEQIEEVDRARDMTERVSELLGLDWDAFRRSVLLAQNQFAGFLEATGTQRNEVLKGVFAFEDLDAMREIAKEWLAKEDLKLAALASLRERAARDREDLEAARAAHADAAARREQFTAAAEEVAGAEAQQQEAIDRLAAFDEQRDRLGALAARLPPPKRVDELVAAAGGHRAALQAAKRAVGEAAQARDDADAALAAAEESAGGRGTLDEAGRLITVLEGERRAAATAAAQAEAAAGETAAADAAVRDAERAAMAATSAAADAQSALDAATARLAAARDRLHDARHREMASTLRFGLSEGERCPVCEQVVTELPAGEPSADVAGAARAVDEAEAKESGCRDRATRTAAELAAVRTRVDEAKGRGRRAQEAAAAAASAAAAAEETAAATAARLGELLGEGDPAEVLEGHRTALAAATRRVAEATTALEAARAQRERAEAAAAEARDALGALAAEVAAIAGRLDLDVDVRAEAEVVDTALRRVRDTWTAKMEEAKQGAEDARTAAARAAEERTGLLEGIGLEGDADFPAAVEETRARVATTQATIDVLAGRLEDLERLEEKERATIGRHAVLERLAADLAPSKFQAFVLEEYRRALAELGSEQFEVLSGGRYRFSSDGAFDVIDLMAAEQARAADSLSGGETFLASLALALALAEMVARRGGRLDAFFLDEGFGSLDAEHLDLAMEGVERLVSGAERLVVVVSHVVALRDRIEDLITLDKDPLTGETRVRSGSEA